MNISCKTLMIPQTVTEYQIPGTPRPGRCHFTYRSTGRLEGRFNSPRHPQNYPNDLNCTYVFLATPSQQVGSQQKVHVLYLLSHISLSFLSFPISYCGVLCIFCPFFYSEIREYMRKIRVFL